MKDNGMQPSNTLRTTILALLCAACLAACGAKDPATLTASAREYLAKGDTKAAIIQLKSALQQGDTGETRYLLGRALLDSGDTVGAVVELRKARELQFDEAKVVPALAQALLGQGGAKDVVAEFQSTALADAQAMARLRTSLAVAHATLRDTAKADAALDAALAAVPDHAPALVLRSRMLAARQDVDGAVALIDKVLSKHPDDVDALQTRGELLATFRKDASGAVQAFERALKAKPDALGPHVGLVSLAMGTKDWATAESRLADMKKAVGNAPQVRLLAAQLAVWRGDYKQAAELVGQLLKMAPEHPVVLQLAGAVALHERAYNQAQAHLEKLLQMLPGHRTARVLLAQTYTRSGQAGKALAALEPLLAAESTDGAALAIAGEAYLQEGDTQKAEAAFTKATQINPADQRSRAALAVVNLNKGNFDAGFGELESIASSDAGTTADLTLISAHLKRREYAAAVKATERLATKLPQSPMPHYVRGLALMGQKQAAPARDSFEGAMKADPQFFPAAAQLAAMDLRDNRPDVARERFRAILKLTPGHVEATLALVQVLGRTGASPEEVAGLLSDAIKANPTAAMPRLRLIAQHLGSKQYDKALSAAQDAAAVLPDQPRVLEALGGAQYAAGERNQAIATFNKLVSLQPNSPTGALRLADLHLAEKDYPAARQNLQRAQGIAADTPDVLQRRIALELADGHGDVALGIARDLQKRQPKNALGFAAEGDILAASGKWREAAAAYRNASRLSPVSAMAIKTHGALARAELASEAAAFAKQWIADHPTDTGFMGFVADNAMVRKDYAGAERLYEAVLKVSPDAARVLNNVAWLRLQSRSPGALAYAEKANQLLPRTPPIMETYAQALLAEQKVDEAMKVFNEALAIDANAHPIRLSLAKALLQQGRKDAARAELERLAQAGDKFSAQAEVTQLLKGL